MCNGTLMDKLISFALPLMLSGMLQLMFNAVDIIVVGRFTGSTALAAVGSTTALISTFTNLFIGVSLGANVLAARFYATGKAKEMSETVHTAIALAAISGVVMCIIGIAAAREALVLDPSGDHRPQMAYRRYSFDPPGTLTRPIGAWVKRSWICTNVRRRKRPRRRRAPLRPVPRSNDPYATPPRGLRLPPAAGRKRRC